jgi:hypothetical protein
MAGVLPYCVALYSLLLPIDEKAFKLPGLDSIISSPMFVVSSEFHEGSLSGGYDSQEDNRTEEINILFPREQDMRDRLQINHEWNKRPKILFEKVR